MTPRGLQDAGGGCRTEGVTAQLSLFLGYRGDSPPGNGAGALEGADCGQLKRSHKSRTRTNLAKETAFWDAVHFKTLTDSTFSIRLSSERRRDLPRAWAIPSASHHGPHAALGGPVVRAVTPSARPGPCNTVIKASTSPQSTPAPAQKPQPINNHGSGGGGQGPVMARQSPECQACGLVALTFNFNRVPFGPGGKKELFEN